MNKIQYIQNLTSYKTGSIANVVELSSGGATIPFMARYRKEMTGNLDEVEIGLIIKGAKGYDDLLKRKEYILDTIKDQGRLTSELENILKKCFDQVLLEDLFLPYKKKKQSRADVARKAGLEGLAKAIMAQRQTIEDSFVKKFFNGKYSSVSKTIEGAQDIIAEWVNEHVGARDFIRENVRKHGLLTSKVVRSKEGIGMKYRDYFNHSEKLSRCPSHRFLAIARGKDEAILRVKIQSDEERHLDKLRRIFIRGNANVEIIEDALKDSYSRLLYPSIENQTFREYKEKADKEAIDVFAKNMEQILLEAPLGQKSVLAIDTGFRSGCKVVCLSPHGDLLYNTTIFPHPPQNQKDAARNTIEKLIKKYEIEVVAIGNGTASRETKSFIQDIAKYYKVEVIVLSESGASIYSASEIAREEFPDHDLTVRGAVSIGRRLMDPLAELVKIDPKSVGVGQYQHDVNQTQLKESLDQTVISCVNKVGINLNTASKYLLQYVSGVGATLAQNILNYRIENGGFKSKKELLKVPRFGPKAYEQSTGFLRIVNGVNPLDNTGIHPDSYSVVKAICRDLGVGIDEVLDAPRVLEKVDLNNYITKDLGLPTLKDIKEELMKPGIDPRGELEKFDFDKDVSTIDDLEIEMILPAIIGNITKFGAFADIGIKENGLIHISQITDKYISDPATVLSVNQKVKVKIISIDKERGRINLSMKGVAQ